MDARNAIVAYLGIPRVSTLQDRKLWSVSIALSVTGFGLYALYQQERVAEFSNKIRRGIRAGCTAVDVFSKLGEISGTLVSDVQSFLQDDTATVPHSVRRTTELLASTEFRGATRSFIMALFEGLAASGGEETPLRNPQVLENLIERLIVQTTRRPDLLSFVVRLATRHAADELLQTLSVMKTPLNGAASSHSASSIDLLLSVMATPNGRRVMSSVVTAFTSTLVTVMIEKSRGIDTWDEVFRVISRPNNLRFIQQITGVSSREFARSLVHALGDARTVRHPPACTEITAEVDYSVPPVPAPILRRAPPEPSVRTDTVSHLLESFAAMAQNEAHREMFYQFCGRAFAHMAKILLNDFLQWFEKSVLTEGLYRVGGLLFEFSLFCAIPLIYVLSTNLSMQWYPMTETG